MYNLLSLKDDDYHFIVLRPHWLILILYLIIFWLTRTMHNTHVFAINRTSIVIYIILYSYFYFLTSITLDI